MKSKLIVLSVCLGILAVSLHAGSSDPTVVHGTATFDREGGNWTITTSHQTIINWQSFGVDAGTIMRFVQPGRNSLAVNRVTGLTPSLINGTLTANGRLMLINPNGIMVGPNGVVSASSFIASTLDASNQDLLNGGGINFFGHSTASIENLGTIKALNGDVTLISHNIINNGQLFAPNGSVNLAAGSDVLLTADGELFINGGGLGIANTDGALIDAAQAQLKAHHDNVYALAINNEGIIRATGTAELADGRVILQGTGGAGVTNTGEIVAVDYDGTGGYVDTSSESGLSIRGSVQTGVGGEWLIDPTDLWVVQTANGTYSHEVEAGWVSDQLNLGGNVRLVTRDPGASGGGEEGDINIAATIEKTSGGDASLVLRAHDDILLHGGVGIVNSSADGVLNLRAIAGINGGGGHNFVMKQTAGNEAYINIDGRMYIEQTGWAADLRDVAAGSLRVVAPHVQFRGMVQTTGSQTYDVDAAWAAGGSLDAGGHVTFNGDVDGAKWGGPRDFAIKAGNSIRFYGDVDPSDTAGRGLSNVMIDAPTVWLGGQVNAPTTSNNVQRVRVLSDNARIQDGINIVSAGGRVDVDAGTYYENIDIYKSLHLKGDVGTRTLGPGAGAPIIDGGGNGNGIHITSGDVTVEGFVVQNTKYNGIVAGYSGNPNDAYQNIKIRYNRVDGVGPDHGFGIYVGHQSEAFPGGPGNSRSPENLVPLDFQGLVIQGNEVTNAANAGIVLQSLTAGSGRLRVVDNHVHHNGASGLWIDSSENIRASGNTFENNFNGVFISGFGDGYYEGTANGPYDPRYIRLTDNTIVNNANHGVALYDGYPDDIRISENTIAGNGGWGVYNHLSTGGPLDVSGNYWGTVSWAGYQGQAGIKDMISGNLEVDDWADASFSTLYTLSGLSNVYVDDDWAGLGDGADLGGGMTYGYNAFDVVQDGINNTVGSTVNVAAGLYNESIVIDKPLNLLGANAGIDPNTGVRGPESIIDGTGLGNQNGLRLANVDGDVRVDGFTIQNAFNPAAQRAYQVVISGGTAGSTYLIQNNIINPVGGVAADAADYGVIAQGGDATIRVLNNAIGDAWWHGVMYERWLGETETAYNTFTISDPWATATLHMSYANGGGNGNVTTLQSVHDNIINNSGGSGIVLISGNPWGYNVGSDGVFSNVSIVNNTLTGIGGKGIQLEADSDTSGFQNVTIAGNTMSAAGSSSLTMRGIRLLGGPMNSNVVIENNTISGFDQGILQGGSFGQPVYANGTIITSNTLTDNGTGVQVDGGSMTLTANTITGSNPGLDLYGAADVDAYQNTITASQYGVAIDLADTASLDAEENVISGRVGVRSSSQGVIRLFNNDLSGYTQDAVVNWANNEIDASGNWWGTTDEAVIMDAIGGNESHGRYLVDFTPYLASNTDTDAAAGFQGDFSELYVTTLGSQAGSTGRINEGVGLLTNSTLYINQGDYAEDVVVDRDANLVTIGAKGKSPVTAWSWTSHAGTTVGLDGFFASDVDASANSNGFAFNGSVLINGYTEIQEGPILFGATVDSAAGTHRKLYVKARGSDVTFAGPVGASTYVDGGTMQNQKLSSLVVTGAETLNIHDVYTTGSQRYNADTINLGSTWSAGSTIDVNGPLWLKDSAVITSTGGAVTFASTVDSITDGAYGLTVSSATGTQFGRHVGKAGASALAYLDASGPVAMSDGSGLIYVITDGYQTYNGPVQLNHFTELRGGPITFNSTLQSPTNRNMKIKAGSEQVAFNGEVGGSGNALGFWEVTGGSIVFDHQAHVTTDSYQTYNGAVLGDGYVVFDSGGDVAFTGTVDSQTTKNFNLRILANNNNVDFQQDVGGSLDLLRLRVVNADVLNLKDVTTVLGQTYKADTINLGSTWSAGSTIDVNGSLVLLSDSAISGNGITFDGTVNSDATGPKALAVTDSATTTFLGEVGGVNPLGPLSVNGGGTAIFHGDVTTRGGQLYANGVQVASSVTFADEASGDIQFNTLDGAYEVSVMTDGDVMFDGPVGDARSLGGLEVTSGGIIYLPYAFGGAVISTSDNGGYDGDVVFNSSTQLRSDTELDIAGNLDWRNETVYSAASGPYSLLIGAGGHVGLYDFSDSDADGTQPGMRVRELVVDAGGHIGLYGRMDIRDGVYMRSGGKIARMARRQRIIADELAMLADSGIGIRPNGRRQALRTQVGHLEAETQTGGIYIRNRGDVTLGNVGSYGREVHGVRTIDRGDIRIVSTGDLRLAGGPDMIMGAEDVVLRAGRNVQLGDDSDLALALAFGEMKIRAGRNVRLYSAGAIGLEGLTVNAGRNVRVRPGLDLPDLFMPLPPAAGLGTFGDLTVRAGNNILMGGSDGMAIAFAGGDMTFRALGDTLGIGTGVMIAGGDMTFQAPNGDIVIANTWPWLGENFGATVMYTGGLMTANAGRDIRIGDSEGVILANAVDGFDFDAGRDVSINSSILLGGMDLAPIVIDAFLGQEPGPRSRGLDQRPAPGGNDGRPGPRLPDGLLFALVDSAFDNGLGVNSDAVFDITAQNNVNLVNDGLTLMVAAANDMNIAATDGDVVMVNDGLAQLLLTGMGDMNIQAGGDILGMNAGGLQGVGAILGDLNIRTMDGNIQLGDAGWGLGSYYVTGLGDVTMIGRNVNIDGQVFIGAGMLAMLEPGLVGPIGPGNPPPPKPNDFQGPRDDEGPRPPFIGDGGGDVVIGGLDNVTMSAGRNGRPQVMAPAGQVTVATLNGDIAVEGVVGGSEGTTVWGFGAESDIRIGPGGYVYSDNGRTQIMAGRDLNVIGSVREDASIRGFTDIELWAGRNMTFDGSSVVAGTQRFGLAVNAQADLMAYAFNGQVRVLENPAGANEILTQGGDIAMIGQRGFVGNAPNSRIDSAGGSIVIAAGGEVLMNIPTYSRGGQILVAALGGDLSVRSTISSVGPGGQQGFFGGQVDPTVPAWQVAGPNGSQLVVIGDVSGWQANTKLGVGNIYLLELGGGNPFGNIGLDFLLAGIDPFGSLFDLDDRVKRYYFDNGNLVAPGTPLALPGGGLESLTAVNPWLESQAFRGATVQFYRGYTE